MPEKHVLQSAAHNVWALFFESLLSLMSNYIYDAIRFQAVITN